VFINIVLLLAAAWGGGHGGRASCSRTRRGSRPSGGLW